MESVADPYHPDTRRLSLRVLQRETGARWFYDLMTTLYPPTGEQPEFARLLLVLLNPREVGTAEDGEPEVMLSAPTLAGCLQQEREYAAGNLTGDDSTGAFLVAFRDIVLPELEWTESVPGERVRAAKLAHVQEVLHPLLVEKWELVRQTPPHEVEERVYLDTGATYNAVNRSRERKRVKRAMEGHAVAAPTELAARLYRLLDATPERSFSHLSGRLYDAGEAAAGLASDQARADAEKALPKISNEPKQRYVFTNYSVRLFGENDGVATVATPVRRALLSGCVRGTTSPAASSPSQRGSGASRPLHNFLESGAAPSGRLLMEWMGLPETEGAKAAVKRGVIRARLRRGAQACDRRRAGGVREGDRGRS